jgi:phosphohistidine phosphatase SixA
MNERPEEVTANSQPTKLAKSEGLEIWRLCRHYTIVQAALLVAGHDPAMAAQVERLQPEDRPTGYEAAKHALEQALRKDPDMGRTVHLDQSQRYHAIDDPIDLEKSTIWASNLQTWLSKHGFKTAFFFDADNKTPSDGRPDYLDPDHPRYAPKLAAAVLAWEACDDTAATNRKSAKQALTVWLKQNAAQFGLADEQGNLNTEGIEQTAKVANWQLTGGAPKTPGQAE